MLINNFYCKESMLQNISVYCTDFWLLLLVKITHAIWPNHFAKPELKMHKRIALFLELCYVRLQNLGTVAVNSLNSEFALKALLMICLIFLQNGNALIWNDKHLTHVLYCHNSVSWSQLTGFLFIGCILCAGFCFTYW